MHTAPQTDSVTSVEAIEARRRAIIQELLAIRSASPGSLSEQFLQVPHKGEAEPALRGPYYVLSHWEGGRNRSRRVKATELEQVQQDIRNHRDLVRLCEEFQALTERLGHLERISVSPAEALKKGLKSPSKRTGKSPA